MGRALLQTASGLTSATAKSSAGRFRIFRRIVSTTSGPDVEILSFTEFGPVLAVRPYTHTDHYWQVYFDTNRAIAAVGAEAGYQALERSLYVKPAPVPRESGLRAS